MPPEQEAAMEIQTPWRRDLDEVGPAMEKWARAKLGPDAQVSSVSSPGNGMSSETVLFDMTVDGEHERYAARLAPVSYTHLRPTRWRRFSPSAIR